MTKSRGRYGRDFFVECGRRGGRKRMERLSPADRRRLAEAAVRRRKWRPVGKNADGTVTITIPLEKRFWRILDMGRTLLPPR